MTTTQGSKYQLMPDMTDEEYQSLKQDMRDVGMLQALVFDQDGNLIDGHHRQRAYWELISEGVDLPMFNKEVMTFDTELEKLRHVLSYNLKRRQLNAQQRQELVIRLRKPPFSLTLTQIGQIVGSSIATISRDLEGLTEDDKAELASTTIIGADGKARTAQFAEKTFFTGEQILKAFSTQTTGIDAAEAKVDKAEDLQLKWNVQEGQVWEIPSASVTGKSHRLSCGDALVAITWDHLMAGDRGRLVVTSPPYNQKLDSFTASGMQKENTAFIERMAASYQDSLPEPEYQGQQKHMLSLLYKYTTDDASVFYNHKHRYRDMQVVTPMDWVRIGKWRLRQEIVWDRGSSITMNARMFIPADERIYWLFKGEKFFFIDSADVKAWTSIWHIAARNEEHVSAPFPNELPHRCIVACSEPGDIVLEPYCGSGTTMAEAERARRVCYAVEKMPKYCAVILERMSNMGLAPKLVD